MSLDWNLTGIENYKNLCWINDGNNSHGNNSGGGAEGRRLNPTTEALIWMTMLTGVGWGTTNHNVEEFIARIDLWEKLNEPLLRNGDGTPVSLSRDDVLAHVGLETNVHMEDRADWLERTFTNAYAEAGAWESFRARWIASPHEWAEVVQNAAARLGADEYHSEALADQTAVGIELNVDHPLIENSRWPTLVAADHDWAVHYNRRTGRWEPVTSGK